MSGLPNWNIPYGQPESPDASYFYNLRQNHRQAKPRSKLCSPPTLPTIRQIADVDRLIDTFHQLKRLAGQAPGMGNIRYGDISRREVSRIARQLSQAIEEGTYKQYPGKYIQIPKTDGIHYRTLTLRSIFDRVVAASLQNALQPFWETIFINNSMAWRPGRGVWSLLAQFQQAIEQENRWVLAIDDVRDAFPSVIIDDVMADHGKYIGDERLLALIHSILKGEEQKPVGIDQGCAYSPTALNIRLHHVHDQVLNEEKKNPLWYRYGDNLVYACQSVLEGNQILQFVGSQLGSAGFTLKGKDGPPKDLYRGEKAQVLGFQLYRRKGKLAFNLGSHAWDQLEQNLERAHEAEDPPRIAQQVICGWIHAYGPAFQEVRDDIPCRIGQKAVRLGFREVCSLKELKEQAGRSWQHWEAYKEEAIKMPVENEYLERTRLI